MKSENTAVPLQGSKESKADINVDQSDPVTAELLLGKRLRLLRHDRGLSLRALASQSGLNINTLSMIENGKSSPSVGTLQLLAKVYEVSIADFFDTEPVKKHVVYLSKTQRPQTFLQDIYMENLGKDLAGNAVQPFLVHLMPGADSDHRPVVHTGYEFVYCLAGKIRYQVEENDYELGPGDSLLFESHLLHRWENNNTEEAHILLIFYPTDQHDEPSQIHFLS